jgi:hypothetical protein
VRSLARGKIASIRGLARGVPTRSYRILERRFGPVVREVAGSPSWEALVFAVLIVEDFNRPTIYRYTQRLFVTGVRLWTNGIAKHRS